MVTIPNFLKLVSENFIVLALNASAIEEEELLGQQLENVTRKWTPTQNIKSRINMENNMVGIVKKRMGMEPKFL